MRPGFRYILVAFFAALTFSATMALPAAAHGNVHSSFAHRAEGSRAARLLLSVINRERGRRDAAPLVLNPKLSNCARAHSAAMAQRNALFHDLQGDVCISYSTAGENVGYATGLPIVAVITMNAEMMAEGPCHSACPPGSPEWMAHGHYLNLTNRAFTTIGIGVEYKNGLTWLTEDFVG